MSLQLSNATPLALVLSTAAAAFIFCVGIYPFYIKWLQSKQISQFIREEGPKSHAVKAKTPTMGGLCFIIGILLSSCFVLAGANLEPENTYRMLVVLGVGTCCGLLGLADDYGKVTSKSNAGISAKFRLFCEFGLGLVLGAALYFLRLSPNFIYSTNQDTCVMYQPFSGALEFVYLFAFLPFLVAGSSNALNLHDGMDGLCGGTSCIVFATLAYMLYLSDHWPLACIAASASAALLAFLCYNKYRAKVFMGDTGSLFIGALMASLVACGGLLIWFIPLALIYIVETLSVISQVVYFKLTKPYTPDKPMSQIALAVYKLRHKLPGEGKRLFKMAPIHHHFEAVGAEKGIKEWQVVVCFWLCQIAICAFCAFCFSQ